MGKIISQLLAEALIRRRSSVKPPGLRWVSHPMHARVDLADKEAIYALLDRDGK